MDNSIAYQKSRSFAIDIVSLYKSLTVDKKEFILSKQLLRSGTSIGANLAEAVHAVSRADFLSKVYIALKEASETEYWLSLLNETGYLGGIEYDRISESCAELIRILTATTKTLENKT